MIKENYKLTLDARLGRIRPASDEEIRQIIATCDARSEFHPTRDVVRVIANTGLHNSELAALRSTDIDAEGNWILAGRDRKATHAQRVLPLRPRTASALASLQNANPESYLVLGQNPRQKIVKAVHQINVICPALSQGRLKMVRVRMNYASRLMSAGVPLTVVKYCMGLCDEAGLLGHLSLSTEVKREILRRNLENFLPEF